jgi:hypothetical protein
METYKPLKGLGIYNILGTTVLYDGFIALGILFVDSYVISVLLKLALVYISLYQLYYLVFHLTLKFQVDDKNLYIQSFLRRIVIPLGSIEGYKISNEKIDGIKLSGFATGTFAFGRSFIKKIGTTSMFVTSYKNIFYIKTNYTNYGISPSNFKDFENKLNARNIGSMEWEYKWNKDTHLHKDKSFTIPLIVVSIIISILTINPFILYLMDKLPIKMPLSFDSSFLAVDYGTGKQFAFNQMMYGVLNMAILFCMYYAAHFFAKYDKRSAKKFIYVSLFTAAAFLVIQLRIIFIGNQF